MGPKEEPCESQRIQAPRVDPFPTLNMERKPGGDSLTPLSNFHLQGLLWPKLFFFSPLLLLLAPAAGPESVPSPAPPPSPSQAEDTGVRWGERGLSKEEEVIWLDLRSLNPRLYPQEHTALSCLPLCLGHPCPFLEDSQQLCFCTTLATQGFYLEGSPLKDSPCRELGMGHFGQVS